MYSQLTYHPERSISSLL